MVTLHTLVVVAYRGIPIGVEAKLLTLHLYRALLEIWLLRAIFCVGRAVHIAHHMNQILKVVGNKRVLEFVILAHLLADAVNLIGSIVHLALNLFIVYIYRNAMPRSCVFKAGTVAPVVHPGRVVRQVVLQIVAALLFRLLGHVSLGNNGDSGMTNVVPRLCGLGGCNGTEYSHEG